MKIITAFFMAWGNFCSLPCPVRLWNDDLRRMQLFFFPWVGAVMGLIWYFAYKILIWSEVPLQLQAAVLTIIPFVLNGFIHLDGFMDCCDAIMSRRDLEERQRILKDSTVGAFAVISVVMLFLLIYSSIWAELSNHYGTASGIFRFGRYGGFGCIVLISFLSRACSAYGVLDFKPIGHSQYKASYDEKINKRYGLVLGLLIAAPIMFLIYTGYWETAVVGVITVVAHLVTMNYARKQLGGMSGDISGYALTVAECAGVMAMAVI